MAGFRTIKEVVDAELDGKVRTYQWRKTPSAVTGNQSWFDLSMSPGMPVPKYWFDATPLVAKGIYQSTDGGLYHGANVSPSEKYLRNIICQAGVSTALPMNAVLCDYILYYPTIDDGTTDPQVMDNTVTLPRYTDGKGVQMLAITTGARTGGQDFTVSYTNSDGVAGRTSQICTEALTSVIGQVVQGASTSPPFIGLQSGDMGVRSIQSVTMSGVDTGLFSIILVKPLAQICFREITVPNEKDFLIPTTDLPKIYDDAFLNFICLPQGSLAATTLTGSLKVIWT